MVASHPLLTTGLSSVPLPRRPLDTGASGDDPVRRWYENELGWPTVPETTPDLPVRLRTGLRFDVLDLPLEAGRAALRHLVDGSPVAVRGDRMRLLVAAGSAEELPGILEWLEWGSLLLDLRSMGTGGSVEAPLPPEAAGELSGGRDRPTVSALPCPVPRTGNLTEAAQDRTPAASGLGQRTRERTPGPGGCTQPSPAQRATGGKGAAQGLVRGSGGPEERSAASGTGGLGSASLTGPDRAAGMRRLVLGRPGARQGAAVWLRPPEPGCEVEASLPTVSALGGGGGAPDLVRLVDTVAAQCHRLRLRRARPQAFPGPGLHGPLDQALDFS